MTQRKKAAAKAIHEEVAQTPIAFEVEAELYQVAVNTLAKLPYEQVGNLINALRSKAKPVFGDADA